MQQRLNRSRYRLGELTHVCPRNRLTTGCTWQKRPEDLRGGVDAGRRYQYGSNLLTTTGRCVCRIAVAGRRDAITTSTITCHSISRRRRRRRGRISRTSASRATRRSRTRATCSDTSARRTPSAPPPAALTRAPTAARQDCRAISRKLARLSRVLVCSLAVLYPTVGHTMDVLSPFIPVLCHSD